MKRVKRSSMDCNLAPNSNQQFVEVLKCGTPYTLQKWLISCQKEADEEIFNQKHKISYWEQLTAPLIMIKYQNYNLLRHIIEEYKIDLEVTGDVLIKHEDKFCQDEVHTQSSVTPLWYACAVHCDHRKPNRCFVQLLLGFGANVDARAGDFSTALHMACYRGNVKHVQLLLKNGANPNICNNTVNPTPLLCTVPLGLTYKTSNILFNIIKHDILNIVILLYAYGADLNTKSAYGSTLLHYAAEANDFELAEYLLFNGAIASKDNNSLSPIHYTGLLGREKMYMFFAHKRNAQNQFLFSRKERIEALQLMAGYFALNGTSEKCYEYYREVLLERIADGDQPTIVDSKDCGMESYQFYISQEQCAKECSTLQALYEIRYDSKALQLQCLLMQGRVLGFNSIHFATSLFEIGEDILEETDDCMIGKEGVKMMRKALNILCLNHKIPTYFLSAFMDVHLMYHLTFLDSCRNSDHNMQNMVKILHMCVTLLTEALNNTRKMAAGRTFLWNEISDIYKAASDAICLIFSHAGCSELADKEMNFELRNLFETSDKLVAKQLAEYSFIQWLLSNAKLEEIPSINGIYLLPEKFLETILLAVNCGSDLNSYSFHGEATLHMLTKQQEYFTLNEFSTLATEMVKNGAHIDITDHNGYSPIDICQQTNLKANTTITVTKAEEKKDFYQSLTVKNMSLKCLAAKIIRKNEDVLKYDQNGVLPPLLNYFVSMH